MKEQIKSKLLVLQNIESNIKKAEESLISSVKKVQDFLKEYGSDDALADNNFSAKRTNYVASIRSHINIYIKQKLNAEIQRLEEVSRQTNLIETEDVDESVLLVELKDNIEKAKEQCKALYESINFELNNLNSLYIKFSKDTQKCEALRSNRAESTVATKIINITGILLVLAGIAFLCHYLFPEFWATIAAIVILAVAGAGLAITGILSDLKVIKVSGLIATGLSTILFLVIHGIPEFFMHFFRITDYSFGSLFGYGRGLSVASFQYSAEFTWTYLAVTLAIVLTVGAFMFKKTPTGTGLRLLKGLASFNLWLFLMHLINQLQIIIFRDLYSDSYSLVHSSGRNGITLISHNNISWIFVVTAISLLVTVALATGLTKIKPIASKGFNGISITLSTIALIEIFNFVAITRGHENTLVASLVYIAVAVLAFFASYNLFMRPSFETNRTAKRAMIIFFASYFLLYLTIAAVRYYELGFTSYVITGGYVAIAFTLIVLGLLKNYAAIRRFALGLALVAAFKLVVIDFAILGTIPRVVASISTGFAFIAISFIYQAFAKKLKDVNYAAGEFEEICSSTEK